MTDERVEPTKEWLDALIDEFAATHWRLNGKMEVLYGFRDAILASHPERVECLTDHGYEATVRFMNYCPDSGDHLKERGRNDNSLT